MEDKLKQGEALFAEGKIENRSLKEYIFPEWNLSCHVDKKYIVVQE